MERRFIPAKTCEVRLDKEDDAKMIVGYAAVYYDDKDPGTEYQLFEDYYERILPGAFDRAVREDDVRALRDHDPSLILGRTMAGTCRLSLDKRGLRYEVDLPDTSYAKDLVASMKRGDVTGSSFSFDVMEANRRDVKMPDGKTRFIRELVSVRLYDVSPVSYPAYTATEAGLRAIGDLTEIRTSLEKWRREEEDKAVAAAIAVERERRRRHMQVREALGR